MPEPSNDLYPLIRRAVAETPWAILPGHLAIIMEVLELRAEGVRFMADEIQQRIGAARTRTETPRQGAVAVIPVWGVISHRMNLFSEMSGGTSTETLAKQLRAALADESISAIVLDIDSPGGSVNGVPEVADEILSARGRKPIVAHANAVAASAAYWIASAADEISVTPSGEVGSIGVLAVHEDWSRRIDAEGITVSMLSAGKHKTEGNPYEPLGDEARAAFQSRIDDYYTMFTKAVAKGRKRPIDEVRGGFGEGRMVGAREAVSLGMADRIETLDETISRLAGRRRSTSSAAAEAEPLTTNADLDRRRRRLRAFGAPA